MSDVPAGWAWTTLGEIGAYLNGRGFKKSEWRESGRPIIRIQNLTGSRSKFNYFDGEPEEHYIARDGDLLVSWAATLGVFVWRGPEAVVNQHIFKVVSRIDRHFHRYLLLATLDDLQRQTHGSGMVHITKSRFEQTPVPLPPLNEQRRIVAAIEEHLSRLDAADGSLAASLTRLRALREETLDQAIDPYPERPLGDFSRVFVGATPSRRRKELWGGGVPWVSSGEVAFRRIKATRETIASEAITSPDRLHPPGTVLLGMIGEGKTRGQAAILDVAAAHNQNSAAIRLEPAACVPEWLFYVLMARYQETRRAGVGAQQPALNRARVAALPIPLPRLEEQKRIVVEVEERLSAFDVLHVAIERARRRSAVLRRAVLQRAFHGELVSQDPTDEPATVLLERIRAARAAARPQTRRRRVTA